MMLYVPQQENIKEVANMGNASYGYGEKGNGCNNGFIGNTASWILVLFILLVIILYTFCF